jgi:hypothetical protein
MAVEQVRQASKVLGPLLRRRGTSPAVGASLRKALAALDKSMSGLAAQKQEAQVQAGVAELRVCVTLIQASDKPADHEQLPGIERALGILAPGQGTGARGDVDLAPLSLASDASATAPSSIGSPVPAARTSRTRGPTQSTLDFPMLEEQLAGLAARLQLYGAVMDEPLYRSKDADAADLELQRHVRALRWLGGHRVAELLRAVDGATTVEARLVAGAALIFLGAERGFEWLSIILERAGSAGRALPGLVHTILRVLASGGFLAGVLHLFERPAGPAVGGAVLPLLAEYGAVPPPRLWELARHPSDEVAVAAAQALAWTDTVPAAAELLAWAGQAPSARRANALLFAAVGLGVPRALAEVRARVQDDSGFDLQLLEALAVAGGPADASLILSRLPLATDRAPEVVLAAAHLGNAETLAELSASPAVTEAVSPEILREARRMVMGGESSDDGRAQAADPGVRLLGGRSWSVAGVLDQLSAADRPLRIQRRMALELRVRTGVALPMPFPMHAPASVRGELVAQLQGHFAKAHNRLRPGEWHYQGKPHARSTVA